MGNWSRNPKQQNNRGWLFPRRSRLLRSSVNLLQPLAGIMALSTYFATSKTVKINMVNKSIPVLICHGALDPVVPESLGKKSLSARKLGF